MNLSRIVDLKKEDQTEDLHMKVFKWIDMFTKKYYKSYFRQGDPEELAMDLYERFVVPKKRRDGSSGSELDRFEHSKSGGKDWTGEDDKKLMNYIRTFVVNRLIDKTRSAQNREQHAQENYDEDEGGSTFDRLQEHDASDEGADFYSEGGSNADDQSATDVDTSGGKATVGGASSSIYDLLQDPDNILRARDYWDSLDAGQRKSLINMFNKLEDISPDVKEFFEDLMRGGSEPAEKSGPRSRQQKHDAIEDIRDEVEAIVPGATVETYKLQKQPACRILFPSSAEAKAADREKLDAEFKKIGYTYYTTAGAKVYYKKSEQTADSAITDSLEDIVAKLPAEVTVKGTQVTWPCEFDILPHLKRLAIDLEDISKEGDNYTGTAVISNGW